MSNKTSRTIKLTQNELKLVIEAVGQYKAQLRSKRDRMAIKRGVNNSGKSSLRFSYAQTAQRKFTESLKNS